jgi:hypothetical protein
VRIAQLVDDGYILKLDVQELVHALQRPAYGHIVLELDGDLVIDEGFEEAGRSQPGSVTCGAPT